MSEDGDPYCFQIVFHGINNRTYFLSAESQTQMEQWMKALTCAGYEYMKLMVSELQRQLDELEGNNGTSHNYSLCNSLSHIPQIHYHSRRPERRGARQQRHDASAAASPPESVQSAGTSATGVRSTPNAKWRHGGRCAAAAAAARQSIAAIRHRINARIIHHNIIISICTVAGGRLNVNKQQ